MLCPTLAELPIPLSNKRGWPWTKESKALPERMPDGSYWPLISIVTPSYNQGQFLEKTIRSVLLQGYPNIEYIVMDGGSADESVEIIRRYAGWLTHWNSGPDRGQADAIERGLAMSSGSIVAYLNSDDYYLLGALAHVAKVFVHTGADIVVGRREFGFNGRRPFRRSWWLSNLRPFVSPFTLYDADICYNLPQECTFWIGEKSKSQSFDRGFRFCIDFDWFGRIFPGSRVVLTSRRIGGIHTHKESKSSTIKNVWADERATILEEIRGSLHGAESDVNVLRSRFRRATIRAWLMQFMSWANPVFTYEHPPVPDRH